MILVAGPTGSGKTTTLYSAIRAIKTPEDKFITIEDPVEYQIPDIVQINVNEKKGLTFASGLRSIVRQDPDEIMVGEIRDFETANIAINAALTGHLVLSTIHANNVIDAIGRLVNMGVDPYQFAASFNLIMSQRLIRKICASCRKEHTPDGEMIKLMGEKSGILGILIAFFLGSAAAGPLYAAFPIAGVLLKKGSKFSNVLIFIGAWSTTKIPMLLFEATSMGWKFMMTRFVINIPGIILIAYVTERLINEKEKQYIYDSASR